MSPTATLSTRPQAPARKLAAILVGDVVGYSRLIGADEIDTVETLVRYRRLIGARIERCQGRTLDMIGDSLMAEFSSAVAAVDSAVAIQDDLARLNAERAADRRMQFRFGITVGDVLVEQETIFGTGVNVAARLQGLAEPGGICISAAAYNEVKDRLSLHYEYLGPHRLKNIAEAVRVYAVRRSDDGPVTTLGPRLATDPRGLPTRRTIAVLPFANLADDPELEPVCRAVTEDVVTDLSRFRDLFVIARDSAFLFEGANRDAPRIGRALQVRYVLDGSIRASRERIRIGVRLVDAVDGHQVWAERYDRALHGTLLDEGEVVQGIVAMLHFQLERVEQSHALYAATDNLEAYHYFLRGQHLSSQYKKRSNDEARHMFEQALALDPGYARARAALSRVHHFDWRYSWSEKPHESLETSLDLALGAVAIDESDARTHSELGFVYLFMKEHELALAAYERALDLNPNDTDIMADMADALSYQGRGPEAVALLHKSLRLKPSDPDWRLWSLGDAYYTMHDYGAVITTLKKMYNPAEGQRLLAASYAQLGQMDEARRHAAQVRRLHPNFSLERWAAIQPDTDPGGLEHFVEGLRRAGLE